MIIGAILAGGIGSRMGNAEKPKQFLHVGGKPIIVHTTEKFISNDKLDKVIVLCPKEWVSYTSDILEKYLPGNDVTVIEGGPRRNETIINAIEYIEQNYGLDDETILVTHDAVRLFVTQRILEENIEIASEGVVSSTVIPSTDTIVVSEDGQYISHIPDRKNYYQAQTPQSFRAKRFRELYLSMTEEEKEILTDAAKVFVVKGDPVRLVLGETFNIKVTYPYDLQLAETLLGGDRQ